MGAGDSVIIGRGAREVLRKFRENCWILLVANPGTAV
jgi:hypothetical protein